MWKILSIATVAGLLLAAAPPVGAFHGTAYSLQGTATFATGEVWNLQLQWSGSFGGAGGSFRVVLTNPSDGSVLPFSIGGREGLPAQFISVPSCSSLEIVRTYVGQDANTGGAVFKVTGQQDNCLGGVRGGQRYMHVSGHLLQLWQLDASVGQAFEA